MTLQEASKHGEYIRRAMWCPGIHIATTGDPERVITDDGEDADFNRWNPAWRDILADDWEVVE